jgi:hypothetical protein
MDSGAKLFVWIMGFPLMVCTLGVGAFTAPKGLVSVWFIVIAGTMLGWWASTMFLIIAGFFD